MRRTGRRDRRSASSRGHLTRRRTCVPGPRARPLDDPWLPPSSTYPYRAGLRFYLAVRPRVLRDRRRPGEAAHAQPEPEQETARRDDEHEVEARERQAPVALRLRLGRTLRRGDDAAGVVATAAAVLDLRFDDPARLRVAGLRRSDSERGGGGEQHRGADRAC